MDATDGPLEEDVEEDAGGEEEDEVVAESEASYNMLERKSELLLLSPPSSRCRLPPYSFLPPLLLSSSSARASASDMEDTGKRTASGDTRQTAAKHALDYDHDTSYKMSASSEMETGGVHSTRRMEEGRAGQHSSSSFRAICRWLLRPGQRHWSSFGGVCHCQSLV